MKRSALVIAAVLLCLTAVLAVVHLATRDKVPEGSLLVQFDGRESYVRIDALDIVQIEGAVVNAKGDAQEIHQPGVRVADVLKEAGIDSGAIHSVTAVADDAFSAELQAEEIMAPDVAYLAREADGSMKLIVFGDTNLKRNVRNVVKLVVK